MGHETTFEGRRNNKENQAIHLALVCKGYAPLWCTSLPDSSCFWSSRRLSLGFYWTKALIMGRMTHFPVGRMDHSPRCSGRAKKRRPSRGLCREKPPGATSWLLTILWPTRGTFGACHRRPTSRFSGMTKRLLALLIGIEQLFLRSILSISRKRSSVTMDKVWGCSVGSTVHLHLPLAILITSVLGNDKPSTISNYFPGLWKLTCLTG